MATVRFTITAVYDVDCPDDESVDLERIEIPLAEARLEEDPEALAEFLARGDVEVAIEGEVIE